MRRISQLELTVLADIEPDFEDQCDGLEYQFKTEFLPTAKKEFHLEIANVITKYRRVIYSRKKALEELSGRSYHIKMPKQVVKLPEEIYEQYEPLMEAA